ncbi:unnamed protein product [Mycena citricolor]|uniref:tRNA N(3)-methylcytidine methyltransferase n=1 Tax=Mycena citricolor TaxID=2018698 RepID=A0AAD2HF73_9AGAR|nr:unnamed protein product [Mycena citricolor]
MDLEEGSSSAASNPPKQTSSVHDVKSDKPPWGSRFLTDESDVWSRNAWDHVPPPNEQEELIAASLTKQRSAPVPEDRKHEYNDKPARHWDNFYRHNASNFFRDRKWLHNEFRELTSATAPGVRSFWSLVLRGFDYLWQAGKTSIVEVGCGAGNSVLPLLSANQNPDLEIHAFDYSSHAVKLVQQHALYSNPPMGTIHAAVWDLTADSLPESIAPGSADIVIMVFVFSALHPNEWRQAVSNVHKILKPGGLVLFRDYGRYDMAQLRFKTGRLLDDNFYIRGDKTRVYFFELDELSLLFTGARPTLAAEVISTTMDEDDAEDSISEQVPVTAQPGSEPRIHPSLLASPPSNLFTAVQLGVDRRLLLNRKRQVKMYRCWMQAKFRRVE